ncbi:unnamed protein product, partial [Choristocarpus tenellus]
MAIGKGTTYRGVRPPQNGKWRAVTYKLGSQLYIGTYDSEIEAAKAHDRAAVFVHGDSAALNFK